VVVQLGLGVLATHVAVPILSLNLQAVMGNPLLE